jgi:hemerythrin-like domain-containing protein
VCEYCGCQDIEVIAELTAEHDELRNLGRGLARAADARDLPAARPLAAAMQALLGPHTEVEERGLFPAMAADFGDQLDVLVQEHRSIDAALTDLALDTPSASWPDATRAALAHLFEHILKEQDGVFPAALSTLSRPDWETLAGVRRSVGSALSTSR